MLTFNLTGLSDVALTEQVAHECSTFGEVTELEILRPAEHGEFAAAAVTMSSFAEADTLAASCGDLQFGATVLIKLRQQEKTVSIPKREAREVRRYKGKGRYAWAWAVDRVH